VDLPAHVVMTVVNTEAGVRGNTATNAQKMATLEGGAQVKVPLFVEEGDHVRVDTRTKEYIERVKQ
ncbi:MAG: elongation factor P, partial [Saprospiraceae bacterium]